MTARTTRLPLGTIRVLGFIIWTLLGVCPSTEADIFVSSAGSDSATGTRSRPFATLERARDAVRERKRAGRLPAKGITVWLRAGDYHRSQSLELEAADSGTASGPIVWRAYKDEAVRLLGGISIPSHSWQPVEDASILARLDPSARPHVLRARLNLPSSHEPGSLRSRGFARPTTPAHSELFFAGRPMTLARWPDEGNWAKIAGFPAGQGKGDDHGGRLGELPGGFLYEGDRPRRWANLNDAWVHGYWAWDWANSYEQIQSIDQEQRRIQTAPPHGLYGFRAGQRFFFLNILEELDQPGEWFMDRASQTLYFWPPSPIGKQEIQLSMLEGPLVRIREAEHVLFQGIDLECTRGSGLEILGGRSNGIIGSRIRNVGNLGVVIDGGTNHGVRSCDIFDTGDGGVSLTGGDRQTLAPSGHFVENCHFQRQGRWSKCYVPAVLLTGVGHRVSNNHIHDHPHCAILFTGNDHLIEFNEIDHIALETGDVGAIYTGRDYTYRGNRIRHNYLHETGGVGMGSMGVYMDDCVSGTEVFGNVFYKVHWAMFIGGGRDHRVENNLFVDCDPAVRADGRGLDAAPVWRGMVNDFMREQLAKVPPEPYRSRYPEMKSLDAYYGPPGGPATERSTFKGVPPDNNRIVRNICVGKWMDTGWHSREDMFEVRDNFVTTNRMGIEPSTRRFQLPPDSPAWRTGFQPIPFERIGPQMDTDRRRLARVRRPG